MALPGTGPAADRVLPHLRRGALHTGSPRAVACLADGAQDHLHRRRGADCRRTRTFAQGHAVVSRALLPQHGRPGDPAHAREDLLRSERRSAANTIDGGHSVLAGRLHARPHLRGDDARVEGCLRRRNLHRVHGAARPGTHRAGRRDLSQGPAGPAGGYRRRAANGWISTPTRVRGTSSRSCRPCGLRRTR